MEYENAAPVQDIGAWYSLFRGDETEDKAQEIKPSVTNALGELMIYATQAVAYANFIASNMSSIKNDIETDIVTDIAAAPAVNVAITNGVPVAPIVPVVQPLSMAVANRQKIVECSEKLAAVVKSIDSILARVKIKEQQV